MEKVLEINVMAKLPWGISVQKSMLSTFVYNHQGMINLGYRTSDEALRLAEESGDIYSKGYAYVSHGFSCYCKGFLEEAGVKVRKI